MSSATFLVVTFLSSFLKHIFYFKIPYYWIGAFQDPWMPVVALSVHKWTCVDAKLTRKMFPLMLITTCLCTTWWHCPKLQRKILLWHKLMRLLSAVSQTSVLYCQINFFFFSPPLPRGSEVRSRMQPQDDAQPQFKTRRLRRVEIPRFFSFSLFLFSWFEFQSRLWLCQPGGIKKASPKCQSSHLWRAAPKAWFLSQSEVEALPPCTSSWWSCRPKFVERREGSKMTFMLKQSSSHPLLLRHYSVLGAKWPKTWRRHSGLYC